ncbi:uncharacterized protein Z518_00495 [Rhinocladiella mackenziei CBS 650.93]|uniref:Rhinocladiella mackenziei CBS 650.93 unplaced genomic scaffold supercont1.1, whole genome shotgun sequence n=1 Tax=Rhinocladiella mackenziei CBS 650.93 TaxID=1442369 RepID=A0A0D2JJ25_9EURO|nr:uncharacterized protein Z518_00495 [Rhinocladiella mackenziei CBS 650.93]KIX09415.1 hypothetical protein Z518_00495 [Rhinocladiella mackenziei CBS 650.93]
MVADFVKKAIYSRERVSKQRGSDDVWIIVHGKVYDITNYLDHHPGGGKILKEVSGQDATSAFEDVGHSDDARDLLARFHIGELPKDEQAVTKTRIAFKSKPILPIKPTRMGILRSLPTLLMMSISQDAASTLLMCSCALLGSKLLWPELVSVESGRAYLDTLPAFWKGIVLSSLGSIAIFGHISYQFSKTIVMTKGFRIYPPVMRPSKALAGPPEFTTKEYTTREQLQRNPSQFQPVELIEKTQLTPSAYRFTLRTVSPADLTVPVGQHLQLLAHIPTPTAPTTITRSYTPLSSTISSSGYTVITLAVKIYDSGPMSQHLLNLSLNSILSARGPLGSYKGYHRFLCSEFGMLAAGTGITPMFPLIERICQDEKDDTTITLLYANGTRKGTLLKKELDQLAERYPGKLKVHYFLSAADESPEAKELHGRIDIFKMKELLPPVEESSKYLICGPDGFAQQMVRDLEVLGCKSQVEAVSHPTDQVFIF